ncbi:Ribonucleotide reduction protein [Lacticaseibacillus brantae DSM 23927]|uniref:Ribonucleotide reduction protein n=2 Tax=Lacticaseibacillus brantae TaxID=943673 RepID=A0A0R2AYU6_9LACO|nr:Ribonucleotide reduction protein [Lacticaseibacillus brantae DSM 23927]
MQPIQIRFISISGNTRAFAEHLQRFAQAAHDQDPSQPTIELEEISDATLDTDETQPYVAMVPTYLDGGNGIDNGVKELMTNALGEYIQDGDNARYCLGIIGSGNRNFNEQYCLTAKRYAQAIGVEMIADYELRGTDADVKRIYPILVTTFAQAAAR